VDSLLREQNADIVAFDVVGDEVGFAVVVHVNDLDAPGASPGPERRSRRAFKAAVTVAEKYRDPVFRTLMSSSFAYDERNRHSKPLLAE
jgi:hypothetical protein